MWWFIKRKIKMSETAKAITGIILMGLFLVSLISMGVSHVQSQNKKVATLTSFNSK